MCDGKVDMLRRWQHSASGAGCENHRANSGKQLRLIMTLPPWPAAAFEGPTPGAKLQSLSDNSERSEHRLRDLVSFSDR